ncbi:biopolymer transporter ExbD [Ruficoccus amylovorans]|uniref:Biopolymer transporter ExbD n=1 Tax=Ruficoccus amylovorans TaxID=1804625 RepID=A0A842HL56_9BACT|nr:biopolymer transporter ExbD [Ruficoccus amylovorans]MBC2596197.1 biopolymer transporter ExbD [Ruficoccus amylovorans]
MNIQKRRKKAEINIVPLIDVLIVLIFFFLMTMQFKNMDVLNITPPKMETAGKDDEVIQLMVGIDTEGKYFIDNQPVTAEELIAAFDEAAGQQQPPSVLLMADENVPFHFVTFVMDQSRKAKLTKVRMQTR